jgi:GDP-4-dehydro-6-deoxy-D-mannose reductase
MPADLLVTGSRGFVGRHVVEHARRRGLAVTAIEGDLREPRTAETALAQTRARAVIHLAERKPLAGEDPLRALAENVQIASNVVAAVRAYAPDAVVLAAGSAAQYGMGAEKLLAETDPTQALTPYAAGKCVLEATFTSRPLLGTVRAIFVRSFNHVGPGQPPSSPVASWAHQVADAEQSGSGHIRTGRLDAWRDFLDVRDIAAAYLSLVETDAEGVVNVCSGHAVQLQSIVERLCALAHVEMTPEHDPALERPLDPPFVVGDPARLHSLVDWRPEYDLERSLVDVLDEARSLAAGRPAGAGRGTRS